jgi:hypothetical protein
MNRSTLGFVVIACLVAIDGRAQEFNPYQAVGYQSWCLGFNPYTLRPGQPARFDPTAYDEPRCKSIEAIEAETVTKLSLPEGVTGAPGSEYAWLIVHQTDRVQVQNVLLQLDGFTVPVRHFYQMTLGTRRLAIPLHELPELRGRLATFSVLLYCGGGCSAQISMRDASAIWPHPTIVNAQAVTRAQQEN